MDITLIITYPISSNFSKKKVSPAITMFSTLFPVTSLKKSFPSHYMFSALPYALLYNETRTDFCILCIL